MFEIVNHQLDLKETSDPQKTGVFFEITPDKKHVLFIGPPDKGMLDV